MKNVTVIEINRPQKQVAALLADPTTSKQWMEDLDKYEPLNGKPGMPGSTARLTFKNGKRSMAFVATIQSRDLPGEIRSVLDSPFVHITAVARLEALPNGKTRYSFEQQFTFKGLVNKIFGLLAQGSIKNQQRRHLEGFKRFAEQI